MISIAIDAAKQALPVYEGVYPNDNRLRRVLEAALDNKKRGVIKLANLVAQDALEDAVWSRMVKDQPQADMAVRASHAATSIALVVKVLCAPPRVHTDEWVDLHIREAVREAEEATT